jgi:hypothetical protein
MSTNTKRISWGVVLSAISLVVGWQVKGCNTYVAMAQRVTAVEVTEQHHTEEYRELRQDVQRVNDKLDRLLERR